ncbi:TPA: DUF551 domain-containing protein [Klebsiella pneumoniae]
MTKSTITREESVQAVFDLKVGYRLGFADIEILKRVARMALAAMDSRESVELPLDYLQGHKDGLEWAAQLAESNHPQTGDWLYDDPIELAKAIRKGPDMPPVQPVADSEPVAEITEDLGRLFVKIHYPTTLKAGDKLYRHPQPAPVAPVCTCPSGDGSLRWPCPVHPGNSPVIPDGWTGSDKANAALMMLDRIETADPIDDDRIDGIKRIVRELAAAPHDAPALNSVQSVVTVPGKWIPVSERMPEAGVKVLCFPVEDEPIHAVFNGQLWLQDVSWSGSEEPIDNVIPVPVTHWMPLPEAPQEVSDA